VNNPVQESERIFDFLRLARGAPFQPKEVKTIGFSDEERNLIQNKTRNLRDELKKQGLADI